MEKDTNLRRRRQQIYSLPPLATRESIQISLSGTNRARTYDPLLVRQMLSQLSYDPILNSNVVSFDTDDPEETRTLDLRRDRAAL